MIIWIGLSVKLNLIIVSKNEKYWIPIEELIEARKKELNLNSF